MDIENIPEEDLRVIIKCAYHLTNKAYPEHGRYSVPAREFERLKAKSEKIQRQIRGE